MTKHKDQQWVELFTHAHLFLMRSLTPPLHLLSLEGLRGHGSGPGQHSLQTQTNIYFRHVRFINHKQLKHSYLENKTTLFKIKQ